ncbi:hypothetical protein MBLNU459_g5120t1 [Dothideomycetes sp. NU459]
MDRSRKRKAAAGAAAEGEGGASKRQKIPQDSDSVRETPESTTQVGLRFLGHLKDARDKTGRSISDLFLELPDKHDLPDYYRTIKLPIAIGTIESKLHKRAYPSLAAVESDLKRMVANAKLYNDDKSLVYGDAERIRKLVSNFMTKNNPAYRSSDYIAVPTPIPDDQDSADGHSTPAVSTRVASEQPRKPTVTLSLKGPRDRRVSQAANPPAPHPTPDPNSFAGKTFQQTQEQIINDLIKHTEDDVEIFQPFVNLPPRSLTDYYHVIRKPVSLTALRKKTRGQHGREPPTMQTDFKTWDAFEDEASYIWTNAREYNEDGSDMYTLAGELEEHFKRKLALAKDQVEEPEKPRIKLNAGRPKPVLHLGAKSSPAPPTPGVTVDNDALARQKKLVQAGVNGHRNSLPTRPSPSPARSTPQPPAVAVAAAKPLDGKASSPPLPAAGVKAEKSVAPSPALANTRLLSAGPDARQSPLPSAIMPPPAPRPASGSPHPSALPVPFTPQVPVYIPAPATFADSFSRRGSVAEALLPNLAITTHPQLSIPKPYRLDIPPSAEFTQQSLTLQLPASHYYIQIIPTVSPQLMSGRQYKLFVTVNGIRLMATNKDVFGANAETNGFVGRKQVYETALGHGVNRIEVEIVAVTGRGGTLEVEKLNLFANLLRH